MSGNLFKQAAAYRKKHPKVSQSQAVKICAKTNRSKRKITKKISGATTKSGRKKGKPASKYAREKHASRYAAEKKKADEMSFEEKLKHAAKGTMYRHGMGKARKNKKASRKRPAQREPAGRTKKIKIKFKKNALPRVTISGISMDKIHQEHKHQQALDTAINRHQGLLKTKGLSKQEKDHIRKEIRGYREQKTASKRHVGVLKKSI